MMSQKRRDASSEKNRAASSEPGGASVLEGEACSSWPCPELPEKVQLRVVVEAAPRPRMTPDVCVSTKLSRKAQFEKVPVVAVRSIGAASPRPPRFAKEQPAW